MATILQTLIQPLDLPPIRWDYSTPEPLDLLRMINFLAPDWNKVVQILAELQDPKDYRTTKALLKGDNKPLLDALDTIVKYCKTLNLEQTLYEAERVRFRTTIYTFGVKLTPGFKNLYPPAEFARDIEIVKGRFNDELTARVFLALDPGKVRYFRKPESCGGRWDLAFSRHSSLATHHCS